MRPYSSYASNANRRARPRPNGARKWGGHNNNATVESHGPNVKIRGTAAQVAERYLSLARDALASDRVKAESYYQHAEHYLRVAQGSRPQGNRRPYGNNEGQAASVMPDGTSNGMNENNDPNAPDSRVNIDAAPTGETPSGGAPTGGTPSGGAPTGGTPSGGAPTGGTPSGEEGNL